jgi:hypothetical protein
MAQDQTAWPSSHSWPGCNPLRSCWAYCVVYRLSDSSQAVAGGDRVSATRPGTAACARSSRSRASVKRRHGHDYVPDGDIDKPPDQEVDRDEQRPGARDVGADNRRNTENCNADRKLDAADDLHEGVGGHR